MELITGSQKRAFTPIEKLGGLFTVGQFNSRGVAEGPIGAQFGPIRSLLIEFTEDHQTFVLRKINIKLVAVHMETRPCCEPDWKDPFPDGDPIY